MSEKKQFTVPVRYSGKIEYLIEAATEAEAMELAEQLAEDEDRLGVLSDIDYEVKSPVCVNPLQPKRAE